MLSSRPAWSDSWTPSGETPAPEAARQTAAEWTWEQHYRKLLQVLAEVAARKQAA